MSNSKKIKDLLKKLTLEEKAALLEGKNEWETHDIPRLGIPSATCSDGPSGVRRQEGAGDHLGLNPSVPATCFPSAATVANSWDEALAELVGMALGEEAQALGVDFLLGPGLNIKRSPLCGRNFEYFSEDPYLAGKMAAGYVKGIQSQGVSACPKHFAVNSQEERRMAMNAVVDERTLREIYLTGFEIAVTEAKPMALMTSYNEVNGTYANENPHLLKDILRDAWGYDGIVITDWGGSNDHVEGVRAGSNLEMPNPGYDSARSLIQAYKDGRISMDEIDECVGRLLEAVLKLKGNQKRMSAAKAEKPAAKASAEKMSVGEARKLADNKEAAFDTSGKADVEIETADLKKTKPGACGKTDAENVVTDSKKSGSRSTGKPGSAAQTDGNMDKAASYGIKVHEHHALARRAAQESIVLLKNEGNILPLDLQKKTVIIGDFAREARYQGAGSSSVNSTKVETILELIEAAQAAQANHSAAEKSAGKEATVGPAKSPVSAEVQEEERDGLTQDNERMRMHYTGFAQGYRRNSGRDEKLEQEAAALASQADQILYFFGLDEVSESEGIDRRHMRIPENQTALLEILAKTGKPVIGVLSGGSAIEMPWESQCQAIVHTYLGGQAGAGATLDVLTGKVNPSGKLNETYPVSYEDTPAYNYFPAKKRNSEYREGIFVGYRYYATAQKPVRYPFGYGLSYTTFAYSDLKISESDREVRFTLTNTGARDGAEVAQLYIGCRDSRIFRPARELKGFRKVFLKAGESRRVSIPLDDKAFRFWNTRTNRWDIEGADYQIMIGANAEDIRLTGSLFVKGTTKRLPYEEAAAAGRLSSYCSGQIQNVSDEEFAAMFGGEIPEDRWSVSDGKLTLNDAICQMSTARNPLARGICKILKNKKEKSEQAGKPDLNVLFIYNMPFRSVAKMTGGMVSIRMAEGMVTAVNGHFFRGLGMIIGGFFKNRKLNKAYAGKLGIKR
ncbi:MAG: glycoside hydrolase family 3 C-terminal domain-containing protein [Lachnospiraceae bacterium]|nr:glycoside hydrolase family 3 C-terminal domain-containing protein [Lachnospiraceae bacterium]